MLARKTACFSTLHYLQSPAERQRFDHASFCQQKNVSCFFPTYLIFAPLTGLKAQVIG